LALAEVQGEGHPVIPVSTVKDRLAGLMPILAPHGQAQRQPVGPDQLALGR